MCDHILHAVPQASGMLQLIAVNQPKVDVDCVTMRLLWDLAKGSIRQGICGNGCVIKINLMQHVLVAFTAVGLCSLGLCSKSLKLYCHKFECMEGSGYTAAPLEGRLKEFVVSTKSQLQDVRSRGMLAVWADVLAPSSHSGVYVAVCPLAAARLNRRGRQGHCCGRYVKQAPCS